MADQPEQAEKVIVIANMIFTREKVIKIQNDVHTIVRTYLVEDAAKEARVGCDLLDIRLQMTFFTLVNLANDSVCLYK